jgi:hypothetical protein
LIKDFSHPGIHRHYPIELGLCLTHLNQSSVEVQIKPLQVKDFSSTHPGVQSNGHNRFIKVLRELRRRWPGAAIMNNFESESQVKDRADQPTVRYPIGQEWVRQAQ